MKIRFFLLILGVLLLSYSCSDDDNETGEEINEESISQDILDVNKWIYENMEAYLWSEQMPDIDYKQEEDPIDYFSKLIYEEKDRWSWITDDYASLSAEYDGVPVQMGYSPSFYLMSDNESVFIVVDYVYAGSPAEEAGIERGDIILSIDGTSLNTTNYYDLYSQDAYSVQLAEIEENVISYTGESIDLVARVVDTNPVLHYDVIDLDGHKVGYLVYAEFITGGEGGRFLDSLDVVFSEFKAAGISDLIVDLRYNPGGDIDAAAYLASAIAPADVSSNEEVLISMKYNKDLQDYFEYYEREDNLYYYFRNDVENVNMKERVYFLTSSGTASSSELVISGLMPYTEVVTVGEATYGKCYGAWVLPDDKEEWAIIPIVMKYANADGYTDFTDGIPSDYEVGMDLLSSTPFGDLSDPALAKALSLATGQDLTTEKGLKSASAKYRKLVPAQLEMKRNLIISERPQLLEADF
ncbi:S41 family peptidase [Thermophagus sp. OGC60D27]|uniref:S41 family peptidase n=1 Tax=Thermophagus sp. OGC60D27 TaxID=3458415 RepID=UPI0040379E5F